MTNAVLRWARTQLPAHPVGRAVAASALIGWIGTGVWISASTLFFTRLLDLTPDQVGGGLAMGGVLGLLAMVPISSLARRRHAGRVATVLQIVRGLSFLAFLTVHSTATFYLALALVSVTDGPGKMFSQIVVGRFVPADERTKTMAGIQVATNIGVTVGALLGTLGLLRVDRTAFDAVVAVVAVAFFLSAWLLAHTTWRTADLAREPAPSGRAQRVGTPPGDRLRSALLPLRDRGFALLTAGNGLLSLHIPLLSVMTPLWLAHRTSVPPATMGALLLLNTLTVVALQVPLGNRVRDLRSGVRAGWAAGVLLAGGCGLLALAAFVPTGWAVVSLAAAVLCFTLGEIVQVTAGWTLSFALAPEDHRQALYLGFFGTGPEAVAVLGPAVLAWLTTRFGAAGFAVMALTLLGASALVSAGTAARGVRHPAPPPAGEPAAQSEVRERTG
ncbi:MFS transporter [Kitasatospora mediocidica]|uniref:MFS transporter n=1 Tax=Kitasatospora mediocidica TaxID=58352 RepID=UPI000561444A|nr:MFS transporter [Kitasatospora mediocidica]